MARVATKTVARMIFRIVVAPRRRSPITSSIRIYSAGGKLCFSADPFRCALAPELAPNASAQGRIQPDSNAKPIRKKPGKPGLKLLHRYQGGWLDAVSSTDVGVSQTGVASNVAAYCLVQLCRLFANGQCIQCWLVSSRAEQFGSNIGSNFLRWGLASGSFEAACVGITKIR
jgi:hypothetical protein